MQRCCHCAAKYTYLAIDIERQKLYYADSTTDAGKVGELSTDGTATPRLLYTDRYCKPGNLVLDADNRFSVFLFFFSFLHYSVFLVPCGRLSWLPVRFWAHEGSSSYRVVLTTLPDFDRIIRNEETKRVVSKMSRDLQTLVRALYILHESFGRITIILLVIHLNSHLFLPFHPEYSG